MKIITKEFHIRSQGENDIIDITKHTSSEIKKCSLNDGFVIVFVIGSTAAVTTLEYEPGLKTDFPNMLSRIAPKDIPYSHDEKWHDGNGHSHVRASLIGPSLTVPFTKGELLLGTWQQIVLIEMDTRSRDRKIILQIIGQ